MTAQQHVERLKELLKKDDRGVQLARWADAVISDHLEESKPEARAGESPSNLVDEEIGR